MTTRTFARTFTVTTPMVLALSDLPAVVKVRVDDDATRATVSAEGDDTFIDALTAAHHADRLTVSAKDAARAGGTSITVDGSSIQIGNGRVQVNSFGRGSIAVAGNIVGGVISAGDGSSIQIDGDQIIVNGRNVATGEKPIPRTITITVPAGTDIGADDVDDLDIRRVGGRVRAGVARQSTLIAEGVRGAKLAVRGQSKVTVGGDGPLDVKVSGQSTVSVAGRWDDVDLEVSGQSTVGGAGEFGHVAGSVSGQSTVRISRAAGQSVRSSGQSTVWIDAPAPAAKPRATGGWNF